MHQKKATQRGAVYQEHTFGHSFPCTAALLLAARSGLLPRPLEWCSVNLFAAGHSESVANTILPRDNRLVAQ